MATTNSATTSGTMISSVKIRWGNEIRRVGATQIIKNSSSAEDWSSFVQRVQSLFQKTPMVPSLKFQYLDNDGDLVTFSSTSELEEAVRTQAISTTTLNITVTDPTTTQQPPRPTATAGRRATVGGHHHAFGFPFVFRPATVTVGGAPRPPAATVVARCHAPTPQPDCGRARNHPRHPCCGGVARTLFGNDIRAIIDRHTQTDHHQEELKDFISLVKEAVRTERQKSCGMFFGGRGWTHRILANEAVSQPLIAYLQQHPNCIGNLKPLLVDLCKHFAQKNLPFLPVGDMVNRAACNLLETATEKLKTDPSAGETLLAVAQAVCSAGLSVTPLHPVVLYNAACCESLLGNTPQALTLLNSAFTNGYCDWEHALNDSDLENVRKTDQFHALLAAHRKSATEAPADEIPVNKPENTNNPQPRASADMTEAETAAGVEIGSLLESVVGNRALPAGPNVDNIATLFQSLLGGLTQQQQQGPKGEEGQQEEEQHPFISFVKTLQQQQGSEQQQQEEQEQQHPFISFFKALQQGVAGEQEEDQQEQQALFNSFVATTQPPTSPVSSATTTTTTTTTSSSFGVGGDTTVLSTPRQPPQEEEQVEEVPAAVAEEEEQPVVVEEKKQKEEKVSPQVVQLQAMGFDLPVNVLEQLLAEHSGNLQRCVNALLA